MTYSNTQPQQSVAQRAQTILGMLGQINVLYIVLGVLYIVFAVLALATRGSAGAAPAAGVMAVTLLLGLGSLLLYILAIRAARQAIKGVSEFAEGHAPAQLEADIRRFNGWLTAGQWLAILGTIINILTSLGSRNMLTSDPQLAGFGMIFLLPALFISIAMVVLSWLIYGSVKSFFTSVLERATGGAQAVTPAAERAASWLQFVYIVQWIGVALAALGLTSGLLLAARNLDSADAIGGLTFTVMLLAVVGWLISLGIRLIGHSRLFALDAARQLDRPQHLVAGTSLSPNPWGER